MINNLSCFSFLGQVADIIVCGLIAFIVVICIILMAKYEYSRKILGYVLGLVMIVVGVFSGIELYKEVKAESYINGSIDISNKFSQDSFSYTASSLNLYHTAGTDSYYCELELLKVDNFDGEKKSYELYLNDYILLDTEILGGSINSDVQIDFYDTEGNLTCVGNLHISIRFLSNKTMLNLSTTSQEQSNYFEQYFSDYGINIKVLEIL